jgi:energy-coupling factor transporter ATP-binding protein EcfA2
MQVHLQPRAAGATLLRPRVWIKAIHFVNGFDLELARHETLVVVGPNNAGKSLFLRELHGIIGTGAASFIKLLVRDVELETDSTAAMVVEWAKSITTRSSGQPPNDPILELPFTRMNQTQVHIQWQQGLAGGAFQTLANLFSAFLGADGRLSLVQSVNTPNFASEIPTHPLHHLYEDDELEARLSKMLRRAFGLELVVNRTAGSQIVVHLAEAKPEPPPGKDRLSKEYRQAVSSLPQVVAQGDGIKAFVGLLLHMLVLHYDITLVDEPEAFLHPPQARLLGHLLATRRPRPSQLIVATHSSDILKGLLDAGDSPVRVVRVQRRAGQTIVAELRPDLVREVWQDPLLRYSGVFDGLFHQGVIVCESDSDCRFYGAMMDVLSGEDRSHDLLLVHGGGKARIPNIIRALRAIEVPVRAVFDFDVLSEEAVLQLTVEALGRSWTDLRPDWNTVRAAIEGKRPELATKDVREKITATLSKVKTDALPKEAISEIRETLRSASAWSEAKRTGKAFVPRGEQTVAYERLANRLTEIGVHLVEVGELEGFSRSVGHHGPAWTVEALERDLVNDSELSEAREFANKLLAGW